MRAFATALLFCAFVVTSSVPGARTLQRPDPAAVLAAARDALGGEKSLTALHSLVATGRTRQVRGNNLVPIEFEMNLEWPDRYVRRNEIPAQDSGLTVTGFVGDTLVRGPTAERAGAPPAGRGAAPPPAAQVNAVKADLVRLLLGVVPGSLPSFPLTFTYIAVAEAPEGTADVLEADGPNGFSCRLFVQQSTHLPVMLTWREPPTSENRLYFADYRDVGGLRWPFRVRRAVEANTIEETTFDRVRINVRIDPKKFEAPK